jgi:hypothetical protein
MTNAQSLVQEMRLRPSSDARGTQQYESPARSSHVLEALSTSRKDLAARRLDHFLFCAFIGTFTLSLPRIETRDGVSNGGRVAARRKVFCQEGSELWQYSAGSVSTRLCELQDLASRGSSVAHAALFRRPADLKSWSGLHPLTIYNSSCR